MNTIISILLLFIQSDVTLTSSERVIALTIVKGINSPNELTSTRIAAIAGVNNANVLRFVKKLGFRNFTEFKISLATSVEIRRSQLAAHLEHTDENVIIKQLQLMATMPFDIDRFLHQLDQTNEAIEHAQDVVIIGAMFPEYLCMHYAEDMIVMGKTVYTVPQGRCLTSYNDDPDALYLFVSVTGRVYDYFSDDLAKMMNNRTKIVSIGIENKIPDINNIVGKIGIPLQSDDESGNAMILLIMQLLKYRYAKRNHKYVSQ